MNRWRLTLLIVVVIVALLPMPASVQAQEPIIHVVQAGENLFRISLRYGVSMDAIMAANGLTDPHRIYVGQQLIIPGGVDSAVPAEPPAEPPPEHPPEPPESSGGTYRVQPGDTLSRIAARFGVTLWSLAQANNLPNANIIYVGQQLVIPGATAEQEEGETVVQKMPDTYVVQRGDTLTRIAQRFDTTVGALAYRNGITNPSAIYVGQVLYLTGADAPVGASGAKRILVDLSEQHLYAYQGDELVFSFIASTGQAPTYTRAGEFRVQSKIPNAYGATWDIWMPHWLGIYWAGGSENGIHALPILPNGQTLWEGYLGTPISYGCVVLGTYEAKLLYDWAELGTPVTIQP